MDDDKDYRPERIIVYMGIALCGAIMGGLAVWGHLAWLRP